jgi:hypothetical protein
VTIENVTHLNVITSSKCTIDKPSILSLTIIDAIVKFILPLTILSISGCILIYRLKSIRGERWSEREKTFSRSVFALSSLFVVTQIPCMSALIYLTSLKYMGTDTLSDEYIMANFVYTLSMFLSAYSFIFPTVVNFAFNNLFRKELLLMLGFKSN